MFSKNSLYSKLSIIAVLASVLIISRATSYTNEKTLPERSTAYVMAGFEMRENLCANATIRSSSKVLTEENLRKAIDGNPSTGFEVLLLEKAPLEINFQGRPPWLNEVYITHKGRMSFKLTVLDLYRTTKEWAFISDTVDQGSGVYETKLTCADIRATSLLIELTNMHSTTIDGSIMDIRVQFASVDTDDGRNEVEDEWINQYKSSPCGGSNLSKRDNDARDFSKGLRDRLGWTWVYDWGNADAWENDFSANGNPVDIDNVDFCYFSGHGNKGKFKFSHQCYDCSVTSGECIGEWGEVDLEWIAVSSCRTLHFDVLPNWFRCFNHLHLMCGNHTNMLDVNVGKRFSKYLGKYKMTIPQAWFIAQQQAHPFCWFWWNWQIRKAMVLAEVKDNFNDHVWGGGYVSPDPPHNNKGWYWWYQFISTGTKAAKPARPFERSAAKLISYPERKNLSILVPVELLSRSPAASVPELNVGTTTVDSFYVRGLANSFCSYYGIFCGSMIEYDSPDNIYSVYDGPHELYVDEKTGAWNYMKSDAYAIPLSSPPSLIGESAASDSAIAFLNSIGFLPADRQQYDAFTLHQGMIDESGTENPDSSWDMNIAVGFARSRDGYQIVGPGADVHVEYGDGGELQIVNYGGWRDVSEGSPITTISLEDALQDLTYSGPEIAIGGMPLCDTYLVDTAELGYYEASGDSTISELTIVWLISGQCLLGGGPAIGDTSDYQIIMPARYRHPRGQIDSPGSDTTFTNGDTLTLRASATGGTPPYTFYWSSDIDGDLGVGEVIQVTNLSKIEGKPTYHTITLEIADANLSRDNNATAGITVTVAVDTPTLSKWGLIVFAMLVLTIGIIFLRRRKRAMLHE